MREFRNTMLISPDQVKAISQVNYNVSDDTIGYAIRTAQDVYLEELIGTPLYHKLQQLVYNAIKSLDDNIDDADNADYAMLLDEYIEPYLVAKTAVECLMPLTFKVRNVGVTKNTDTNIQASQLGELKYCITYNGTQVAKYATRISEFLCQNKSLFPELEQDCGCCGTGARIGQKFANVPLHIGGRRGRCCK